MSSERDALMEKAYPELQAFCQSLGLVFEVCGLRLENLCNTLCVCVFACDYLQTETHIMDNSKIHIFLKLCTVIIDRIKAKDLPLHD